VRHATPRGRNLERDLRRRLADLGRLVRGITRRAPAVNRGLERTLRARLAAAALPVQRHDPQVLKEIVLLTERAAITEELVRLRSHLEHAGNCSRRPSPLAHAGFPVPGAVARNQYRGRQVRDVAIARDVVAFKTQLESVREQAQNVE